MKTNGNQTAYPTGDHNNVEPEYGISKREYFSALFMQGYLSSDPPNENTTVNQTAEWSVKCADALINALNAALCS